MWPRRRKSPERRERELSIPVVEERAVIGTRPVERGRVRVSRTVHHEPQEVEVPLTAERVEIDRVAVDQPVDEAPEPRWEGDVLVIPRVEEVLVVERQLRVREEVRVRVVVEETTHRETVDVRKEDILVERHPTGTEQGHAEDDHRTLQEQPDRR